MGPEGKYEPAAATARSLGIPAQNSPLCLIFGKPEQQGLFSLDALHIENKQLLLRDYEHRR